MNNWEKYLNNVTKEWLLQDDNPSVKYYTLTDLLEKPEENPIVKKAKMQIMKTSPVTTILEKQKPGGFWGKPEDFYMRSKYRGTVWNLIILAELCADKNDKRIKKTCEFILKNSQEQKRGGFSYTNLKSGGGAAGKSIPCLAGNMIWSFIRFGYIDDPRVQKGINWITTYQRFDDGKAEFPEDWPYHRWENCFGKHTCHMGAVKAVKALYEIPKNRRNKEVNNTISEGVEYLLIHHIYKRSHNLSKISKPSWLQLSFPHMYQTDILEILDILTNLGIKDERMQDALDIIISKQDSQGRWNLERTFNGRFITNIEQKNKPSKWITLNALRVLKKFILI